MGHRGKLSRAGANLIPLNSKLGLSRAAILIALSTIAIRLALSPLPGYDIRDYRLWAELVAHDGVTAIYHAEIFIPYNYPPVFLYILDLVGRLYSIFEPSFDATTLLLGIFLKTPAILADAGIALAIYFFLIRRVSPRSALLGALTYALNPAIIWNTAYWGGIDAIHTLFALLSVIFFIRRLPEAAWFLLALSVLTKPLGLPLAIMIVPLTVARFGLRRAASSAALAGVAALVIAGPFLAAGTFGEMWTALIGNLGNYDNISANAHNFWWLVSGGHGWIKDTDLVLGLVSYRAVGFGLFAFVAAWCLRLLLKASNNTLARDLVPHPAPARDKPVRYTLQNEVLLSVLRRQQESLVFFVGGLLGFAFYMFPTEVHENWMFGTLPFLAVAGVVEPRFRPIFIAMTVTFWLNMVLHDLYFGYDLPKGWLGILLAAARLANAAANNVILVYGAWSLLRTYRASELTKRPTMS